MVAVAAFIPIDLWEEANNFNLVNFLLVTEFLLHKIALI